MSTISPEHLDHHLVSLTSPFSFVAEQYQGLRLKLEQMRRTRDLRVIAVTSPGAGDGKTLTSINLAGALARSCEARVMLMDADFRRAAVAKQFGITDPAVAGLADVVSNPELTLAGVTHDVEPFSLSIVPAGRSPEPVHKILRSPRLERLIQEARERYDYVIIDTPPLAPVFDSALLARLVDGIVVVVAAGKTPRRLCEEALNLLDATKVLGLVFNGDTRPRFRRYLGYYGGYFSTRDQRPV